MNRIFNFYTHWIIVLSLLEKYTKINVYPSVIICLIGSTLFSFYFKLKATTNIALFTLHLLPFIWTKPILSTTNIIENLYLGITYIVFIAIQEKSIYEIYKEQFLFLKKNPDLFTNYFIKGNTNMCLFC